MSSNRTGSQLGDETGIGHDVDMFQRLKSWEGLRRITTKLTGARLLPRVRVERIIRRSAPMVSLHFSIEDR